MAANVTENAPSKKSYIELKNISKSFGVVKANINVNVSIEKGEIHALLGENGSGKSTLVNILSGIYSPDKGDIFLDGKKIILQSPKDAIDAGIGMVHQHFKLIDVMTATENIVAGQINNFMFHRNKLNNEINNICDKYGLYIKPDKKVYDMSVSEKQTVEILKVLYRGANVLILDEPTAVLTPQEIKSLFVILRKMKEEGCSIIIITHKLNEVMEISDRVTVLSKGKSVATINTSDANPRIITEMMVGHSIDLRLNRINCTKSENPMLKVESLYATNSEGIDVVSNMNFELFGGEILGVAGIAGSGQKELCEIIAGLYPAVGGKIYFKGDNILGTKPIDIIKRGISMSFIPEDRLGMGLVAGMDIVDNVMLKNYRNKKGFAVDREYNRSLAKKIVEDYDINTPSIYHIVRKLSGGNIQKVLLGREVDANPSLLITAYPVRGLDIGAAYHIYDVLNEQKKKGVAVLFIGEDLDVLLELCDRLMVINGGQVMGIVDPSKVTKEDVGLLMLGQKTDEGSVSK